LSQKSTAKSLDKMTEEEGNSKSKEGKRKGE